MLLPALQKAKEIAKSSLCNNNQRQISQSISFYADDFNDYCNPAALQNAATDSAYVRWFAVVGVYLYPNYSMKQLNDWNNAMHSSVYFCPSENRRTWDGTYGINGDASIGQAPKGITLVRRSLLQYPSVTFAKADSHNDSAIGYRLNPINPTPGSGLWVGAERHTWSTVFSFVDGHTETIKFRNIPMPPGWLNGSVEGRKFWGYNR
jgi:hypothetical protein